MYSIEASYRVRCAETGISGYIKQFYKNAVVILCNGFERQIQLSDLQRCTGFYTTDGKLVWEGDKLEKQIMPPDYSVVDSTSKILVRREYRIVWEHGRPVGRYDSHNQYFKSMHIVMDGTTTHVL